MRWLVAMLMGAMALAWTCGGSDDAESAPEDARAAALAWLELVDEGDYEESWEEAAAYFRGAVSKERWVTMVRGVRAPVGDVLEREVVRMTPRSSLPGAPDGDYVVIELRTSFANRADATETVTPMRDPDGTYRVSGYFIR
ncbi:MAG: DUF4019 domain-containing protein [Myxococcota bacterium]